MTTTDLERQALALATLPYALCNLGEHIIDHHLPAPDSVELNARGITVWVLERHVPAWRATSDPDGPASRKPGVGTWDSHTMPVVLHGSCVRMTLRWIRGWDRCDYPDCDQHVAPVDAPSDEPGCPHGRDLCGLHWLHCSECVDDMRQDRADGWVR